MAYQLYESLKKSLKSIMSNLLIIIESNYLDAKIEIIIIATMKITITEINNIYLGMEF